MTKKLRFAEFIPGIVTFAGSGLLLTPVTTAGLSRALHLVMPTGSADRAMVRGPVATSG